MQGTNLLWLEYLHNIKTNYSTVRIFINWFNLFGVLFIQQFKYLSLQIEWAEYSNRKCYTLFFWANLSDDIRTAVIFFTKTQLPYFWCQYMEGNEMKDYLVKQGVKTLSKRPESFYRIGDGFHRKKRSMSRRSELSCSGTFESTNDLSGNYIQNRSEAALDWVRDNFESWRVSTRNTVNSGSACKARTRRTISNTLLPSARGAYRIPSVSQISRGCCRDLSGKRKGNNDLDAVHQFIAIKKTITNCDRAS